MCFFSGSRSTSYSEVHFLMLLSLLYVYSICHLQLFYDLRIWIVECTLKLHTSIGSWENLGVNVSSTQTPLLVGQHPKVLVRRAASQPVLAFAHFGIIHKLPTPEHRHPIHAKVKLHKRQCSPLIHLIHGSREKM